MFNIIIGQAGRAIANAIEEAANDITEKYPWVKRASKEKRDPSKISVEEILQTSPEISLSGFDPDEWSTLIDSILGVADGGGSPGAVQARQALGNDKFLVLDIDWLTDSDLVNDFLAQPEGNETDQSDEPGKTTNSDDRDEDNKDLGDSKQAEDTPKVEEAPSKITNLLRAMTRRFESEVEDCEQRRSDYINEAHSLINFELPEGTDTEPEITPTIRWAMALSLTLAFISLTVFSNSGWSKFLVFDDNMGWCCGPQGRLMLLTVSTLTVVFILLFVLKPKNPRPARAYILVTLALILIAIAVVAFFSDRLVKFSIMRGGSGLFLAICLFIVVLGLAIHVALSQKAKGRPGQRSLALSATFIYFVLGIVIFAKLERVNFQDWVMDYRDTPSLWNDPVFWSWVIACIVFLVSLLILAVATKGKIEAVKTRQDLIEENADLARQESQYLWRLQVLRDNWKGTATALDYLVRHPFGKTADQDEDDGFSDTRLARLNHIVEKIPSSRLHAGWLAEQYRQVSREYKNRKNLDDRPESYIHNVPGSPDLLNEPSDVPRWDFARRLRNGEFDDFLAQKIVGDPPPPSGSTLDSLMEIVPYASQNDPIPVGVLGTAAAMLGPVVMTVIWFWPEDLEVPDEVIDPILVPVVRTQGSVLYQTLRVDYSDPVNLSGLIGPRGSVPTSDLDIPEDDPSRTDAASSDDWVL